MPTGFRKGNFRQIVKRIIPTNRNRSDPAMDINSSDQPDKGASGRLKPPPNYFSRAVQFKLMMLVGSLLLVIVLMYEARKPENWYFMGFNQEEGLAEEDSDLDTRALLDADGKTIVAPSNLNQDEEGDRSVTGGDPESIVAETDIDAILTESLPQTLLRKTRRDFWGSVYDRMESDWRRVLYVGLREGRREQPLSDDYLDTWNEIVSEVSRERISYQNNILRSIANLELDDVEKRDAWTSVLQQMQERWVEIESALKGVGEGANSDQASTLIDLQILLDQVALDRISDDHLGSRKQEKEIWYRQFERLSNWDEQTSGPKPLADPFYMNDQAVDFEPVGFVQLFKQPNAYRGRRVKVVGDVKLIEYHSAPANDYGVEGYHVLWVRPEGKANLPIVVYALNLPAGVPEYDSKGRVEFERGKLQPISIDALFFKRWAYEASDGVRLCPLLVGLEPDWLPLDAGQEQASKLPSPATAIGVVALIAIVAFGISRFALRSASKIESPGFKMPQQAEAESADQVAKILEQNDMTNQVPESDS